MPFLMFIGGFLFFAVMSWQHSAQKRLVGIDKVLSDFKFSIIKLGIIIFSIYFSNDIFGYKLKQFATYNLFSAEDTRRVIEDSYNHLQRIEMDNVEFYRTIGLILIITIVYGGFSIFKFAKAITQKI